MAMDLVALYKDRLASEDSNRAIREHLKSCPDCRRAYASYTADRATPAAVVCPVTQDDLAQKYHKLAAHLHKQHVVSTAAVLSVVLLSVGVGIFGTIKMLDGHGRN
jgi:hypothetical protein